MEQCRAGRAQAQAGRKPAEAFVESICSRRFAALWAGQVVSGRTSAALGPELHLAQRWYTGMA